MDTLLRRRIMMATGGEPPTPVPPYRPVEYLENPSNARIDTGIVGNGTWEFSAVINATPGTTAIVLGRKSSGSGWIGVTTGNKWGLGTGSGQVSTVAGTTLANIVFNFTGNRNATATVNGESIARNGTVDLNQYSVWLFGVDSSYSFVGRIYGTITCTLNGDVVFNGTPCLNSSDVAGIYDSVSDTFFPSSNSTAFVAGPIIQ